MSAIVTSSVILAAGMGIRMERRGKRMPKGFLRLGDRPIIEESISRLLEVGVRRIVIVRQGTSRGSIMLFRPGIPT
ncbi:MAG: NTP transferase domain-containing protein [Planctomycetes bacterium]|nr:NTP transferase domain-containing protein [Planctomycetota bacterium]